MPSRSRPQSRQTSAARFSVHDVCSLSVRLLVLLPFGFPLYSDHDLDVPHRTLIPKTKGRTLEEKDVIFGAVQEDKRRANIAEQDTVSKVCL